MQDKLKYVVIGDETHPLPMSKDGEKWALYGSTDGQIVFPTFQNVDADYVYGEIMRNLPTRSMLKYFDSVLTNNDPLRTPLATKSYVHCFQGAPAAGKSFMFKTIGRLTHPLGCLNVNCTDIDAGSLFYETVFDSSGAQKEKDAIDARILQGNIDPEKGLSPKSLGILKSVLGPSVFFEEVRNGKKIVAIDWNNIKSATGDPDREARVLDQMFKQICSDEGIRFDNQTAAVGIITRDGPIIRALKDPNHPDYGRPILLDEWNRCKEGTDEKLLEFIAFLSDEKVDNITLPGGAGKTYTFNRKDIPDGFMLYATGNKSREGMGMAHRMSQPQISRLGIELDVKTVPDPMVLDFADRIVGYMTGVPALQIMCSDQNCLNDAKYCSSVLKHIRTVGLSQEQINRIPQKEIININRIDSITKVANDLAQVMYGMHKKVKEITNELSDYPDAYKEYMRNEVMIDMRFPGKFLAKAEIVRPKGRGPAANGFRAMLGGACNMEANVSEEGCEYRSLLQRGSNLDISLGEVIKGIFLPADLSSMNLSSEELSRVTEAYRQVVSLAKSNGFNLNGVSKDETSPVALYNLTEKDIPEMQQRRAVNLLAASIRREFIRQGATEEEARSFDKSQINGSQILKALEKVGTAKEDMAVVNQNLDEIENHPFAGVYVYERLLPNGTKNEIDGSRLVNMENFMESLMFPELRQKNLKALWKVKISDAYRKNNNISEKVFNMANGVNSDIAVTTVAVESKGQMVPLHLFYRGGKNEMLALMVNDEVSEELKSALYKEKIFVLDRKTRPEIIKQRLVSLSSGICTEHELADAHLVRTAVGMKSDDIGSRSGIENMIGFVFDFDSGEVPEICTQISREKVDAAKGQGFFGRLGFGR